MIRVLPLVALAACGSPERGLEYRGKRLDVIDMHLHAGEWEGIPPATQTSLAARFPFPFGLNPDGLAERVLSAEGVVAELDKAGIDGAVLYAVYAPHSVGVADNAFVIDQVAQAPDRLVGFASLRVDRWSSDADAELLALRQALQAPGMVGVKLAHTHMHFRMDDPAFDGIYALAAELDKPVYVHTGPSPFPGTLPDAPYTDPAYLEAAISAHPDADFILGHLGYDFLSGEHLHLETCLRLARDHDNVWLEPSALGSKSGDPTGANLAHAMERIRQEGLVDKTIHGSDGPQFPGFIGDYLDRVGVAMDTAGYTPDEAEAVLSGNFERLFAVELGR